MYHHHNENIIQCLKLPILCVCLCLCVSVCLCVLNLEHQIHGNS